MVQVPTMSAPRADDRALSIGLVTPGWPPDAFPNGIVSYVAALLPPLAGMGHRVSLIANHVAGAAGHHAVYDVARFDSTRSPIERITDGLAHRIAARAARQRRFCRALERTFRAMISESSVEIVEMEESFGTAARVREFVSIPVCLRLHGPWFLNGPACGATEDDEFRRRVRKEREAIASADGITAPSRDVLDRVRAHYGLSLPEAEVIPHPIVPTPAGSRWALGECSADRVLFVGRFDRHKGGDLVIDAFRRILSERPQARLTFVGPDRGCVTDDGHAWSLPAFVQARLPGALDDKRVEWLGQQPFAALTQLRRRAIVTVVASRYETFCYTAAEALALGCPVVATSAGAIPEIVKDGSNGLLCRPEDPADLAEKVLELMREPPRAAALGRQGALDCERLFHPDVIARRMVGYYRGVLARRGRMAPTQ